MTRKRIRKLKPIQVDRPTWDLMRKIYGNTVPYNPAIIERKGKDEPSGEEI